jgi:hypothetical protein
MANRAAENVAVTIKVGTHANTVTISHLIEDRVSTGNQQSERNNGQ